MSTAIITGGAVRIGYALACSLAERGYNIALHYNTSDPQNALDSIRKTGVQCRGYQCDLANPAAAEELIGKVAEDFSDIELLINSASIFIQENIERTSAQTLADTMTVNFMSPFLLMREYRKRVNRGLIVNILDERIRKNIPAFAAYSTSKSALESLTRLAAVEWGATIRVNAIAPGLILPPKGESDEYLKRKAKNIPVKEYGNVADIQRALIYLLDSPFVNGDTLFVDGGESKSGGQSS